MSDEKPREIALDILLKRKTGAFVEDLLDRALTHSRLSTTDRGLCQELVYGVVRWQATLDWLIDQKTDERPQKPVLRELLRLGLYQIFWLDRIPNHAAVNETVASAKHRGFTSQAGFINAILRGYLRESEATRNAISTLKSSNPALGFSQPQWLVEGWEKRWGREKVMSLLEWNNTPPKTFARINTLKADPAKLLLQWRGENVGYDFVHRDWFAENLVFELKSHPPLVGLPSFQQGLFYVQDPSTLLAVQALDPHPGENILDLCAAPGGKLTYMAQLVRNEARLLAYDTSAERLTLVAENCARLGVTCVKISESPVHAASRSENETVESISPPSLAQSSNGVSAPVQTERLHSSLHTSGSLLVSTSPAQDGGYFDKILIDAPCSNTGVLRRRVDLRWRITPAEITHLRQIQSDLLTTAAIMLKTGGVLVYSTCSLEPEENEQVVKEFLTANAGFALHLERSLLPFIDNTDGAYVAKLIRS